MDIDILLEMMEDKTENPSTTSKKFKKDLWKFCHEFDLIGKNAVEFGTHKGQTTAILSELSNEVYTFNLPGNFDEAKRYNSERTNINYIGLDLYDSDSDPAIIPKPSIHLVFSDAVHSFDGVTRDYHNANNWFELNPNCYFVFDDYGAWPEVARAVDYMIEFRILEFVRFIGHESGFQFSNKTLTHYEGIICRKRT